MSILTRIKSRIGKDGDSSAGNVKLIERRSSPGIIGRADFGGVVCGFDLSNEHYSESAIKLTGDNWRKAMDDFVALQEFFDEARDYDKTFPTGLSVSIYDEAAPAAKLNGQTPSGKTPKYAMSVSFNVSEPTVEPEDWDAWIDAYVDTSTQERRNMSRVLIPEPYSNDSIIGTIHYLQSGAIGKADFHFWHEHVCHSVHIRSRRNKLYLSKATRKDTKNEKTITTYQAE